MNLIEKIKSGLKEPCICGETHGIVTKNITIGPNIAEQLWDFQKNQFGNIANGCVICDQNTYQVLHDDLRHYINAVILEIRSHHADEYMVEMCDDNLKNKNYDYFIACGSGTIHDLTRIAAYNRNVPFISYPTAPSVDGFVSTLAPITTKDGMKDTIYAGAPIALFADTDVLANAPPRLAAAGAGDILGKYIALADWRLSNLLTGEYICGPIVETVYRAANNIKDSLVEFGKDKGGESYKKLCAELLEALIISGLCMQYTGNSRPASGAEHHVAHFFEMGILIPVNYLHGENVGIGSVLCAELYHKFAKSGDIKFTENYDIDENLIKKYYNNIYADIIKENAPNSIKQVTPEIFYDNLGEIKKIIKTIPSKEELIDLLNIIGGVTDIDCDKPLALKLAPYIRDRFTLLKLMRCVEF